MHGWIVQPSRHGMLLVVLLALLLALALLFLTANQAALARLIA